ncbi:MAG: endonuclease/exonuclease/phosphatase family protein [Bacteroidota bacterium]
MIKLKNFLNQISVLLFLYTLVNFTACSTQSTVVKQEEPKIEQNLNVMTFNIRYGNADDGNDSWQYRKNMVFEVIQNFNPDFVGIQEALEFQIKEIIDQLPDYTFIGVGRDNGKTEGEYSAILYAKDRFIIDTSETFWFSETPKVAGSKSWGNNITRICTWGKFFDKFTGKTFYVLNVHLDHESIPSRINSAKAIVDKIKSFNTNLPVILTGDFNTGESEETIKIITRHDLTDSYYVVNKKTDKDGTFNSFKGEDTGDKIDYIFINDKLDVKKSFIDKTNSNGKYPSDHFPVKAVLHFR